MMINDEMAAEARWCGGGWQSEGEDGMGGIAAKFAVREDLEVPIYGYPIRPRHVHWSPPRRRSERPARQRH